MQIWLIIEVITYYTTMMAIVIYIASYQVQNWFAPNQVSSVAKQVRDFALYYKKNITWFALLTIQMLMMPVVFLW